MIIYKLEPLKQVLGSGTIALVHGLILQYEPGSREHESLGHILSVLSETIFPVFQ